MVTSVSWWTARRELCGRPKESARPSFRGYAALSAQANDVITPSLQGAVGVFAMGHFGIELGVVVPITILSGRGYPTDPGLNANTTNDDNEQSIAEKGSYARKNGLGGLIIWTISQGYLGNWKTTGEVDPLMKAVKDAFLQ